MKEIEVSSGEWSRLKRRVMTMGVDDAMKGYEPLVRITHGLEYITYEKGGDERHER